ncbi:MAG: M48 family metalloprotease [Pseudomonadota bacterium]
MANIEAQHIRNHPSRGWRHGWWLVALLLCAPTLHAGPGAQAYNEYLEKGLIYPDEAWQDYVTEVGERLLAVSPDAGKNYTFCVIDESIVNAFAMPDGYIFLSRGILAYFNSEDEMAAVIGHEIGHVVGQHGRKKVAGGRLGQLLGVLGSVATGTGAFSNLANSVTMVSLQGYSREFELESDEYGTTFLGKAGYNPRGMLDSIQMLRDHSAYERAVKNRPPFYHGILGSHPAHEKRINELVFQSQHLFPDDLRDPERDFFAMLNGMAFGDEAATGVVKDGVYYHGSLRLTIKFPAGWDVRANNTEVFGRTPSGTANAADITLKRQAPPEEEQTPEEYLKETLRRDDLENGQEIRVGSFYGYIADITVAGDKLEARRIAVVFKDGGVFVFNGELQKGGDVEAFRKDFDATVESMRSMTAADQRIVNNQRLKIIMAEPGQTYRQLARTIPLKNYGEETLRVINGHHPRGEPRAGDYIKLIE